MVKGYLKSTNDRLLEMLGPFENEIDKKFAECLIASIIKDYQSFAEQDKKCTTSFSIYKTRLILIHKSIVDIERSIAIINGEEMKPVKALLMDRLQHAYVKEFPYSRILLGSPFNDPTQLSEINAKGVEESLSSVLTVPFDLVKLLQHFHRVVKDTIDYTFINERKGSKSLFEQQYGSANLMLVSRCLQILVYFHKKPNSACNFASSVKEMATNCDQPRKQLEETTRRVMDWWKQVKHVQEPMVMAQYQMRKIYIFGATQEEFLQVDSALNEAFLRIDQACETNLTLAELFKRGPTVPSSRARAGGSTNRAT